MRMVKYAYNNIFANMKSIKTIEKTFFVTNISDRNVSLCDLNLTIPARTTVNLLSRGHYHLTEEQLELSKSSGSLFKKRSLVKVRKIPPQQEIISKYTLGDEVHSPSRTKSIVESVQPQYEELNISDDMFAQENVDIVSAERKDYLK